MKNANDLSDDWFSHQEKKVAPKPAYLRPNPYRKAEDVEPENMPPLPDDGEILVDDNSHMTDTGIHKAIEGIKALFKR